MSLREHPLEHTDLAQSGTALGNALGAAGNGQNLAAPREWSSSLKPGRGAWHRLGTRCTASATSFLYFDSSNPVESGICFPIMFIMPLRDM